MTTSNQFVQKIGRKIRYERSCSMLNYIMTFLQRDIMNFSGNATKGQFVVWKYSQWTGVFYAVITGKVVFSLGGESVLLTAKMNSFGKFVSALVLLLFCFGWFYPSRGFSPLTFRSILAGLLLIGSYSYIIYLIYRNHKRNLIKEVNEILEEKNGNMPE
jgi:hypothetical protein